MGHSEKQIQCNSSSDHLFPVQVFQCVSYIIHKCEFLL